MNGHANSGEGASETVGLTGTMLVKAGLAQMLKGGVIMGKYFYLYIQTPTQVPGNRETLILLYAWIPQQRAGKRTPMPGLAGGRFCGVRG